jgi:SAM-dependent methyltransferase
MQCDVCGGTPVPDTLPGTFTCRDCGFSKSEFPVRINELARIDEGLREEALKPLRVRNFRRMLDGCAGLLPPGARILEVGCAHGWFLTEAKQKGYDARGIEPDSEMARRALAAGHEVDQGFFPEAAKRSVTFDAIVFNDVFEHLPAVNSMAQAVCQRLESGGLAIINLPVSDGLVYQLARSVALLGIHGPLERMWQKGLPSPHLSYFSLSTMPRLMERAGFELVKHAPLQSIDTKGLYQRIRYDRDVSVSKAVALYFAALAVKAGSRVAPSDIYYFVFRKI